MSPRARSATLAACVLSAAPSALIADISVGGFFQQRFDVRDDGTDTFGSSTDLGFVVTSQTPRTTVVFAPGVRVSYGADDDLSTAERINPRVNFNASFAGDRLGLNAGLSVVPQISSQRSIGDAVLIDPDALTPDPADPLAPELPDGFDFDDRDNLNEGDVLEVTTRGTIGASYALDPLNSVSANAFAQFRRFVSGETDNPDTESYGVSAGWSRRISPLTSISLTPSLTFFTEDSGSNARTRSLGLTAGLSTRLSPSLSFSASLGGSFVTQTSDVVQPGGGVQEEENDDIALNGSVGFGYTGARAGVNARFSQGLNQNDNGEVDNTSVFSLGGNYRITPDSQISSSAALSFETPVFNDGTKREETLSLTSAYALNVSREWTMRLGHRISVVNDDDRRPDNLVFLQLSRGLTLLP